MFEKIVKIRNNFNPEMYYIKMILKTNQKTAEVMCLCITSAIIIVKLKKVTKKHHIMWC